MNIRDKPGLIDTNVIAKTDRNGIVEVLAMTGETDTIDGRTEELYRNEKSRYHVIMITLERVRLVCWHYFDDAVIEIGDRCLFAGDNGSGKSTIVDAVQYAIAADLRKARFNAAAGDRRSGRDLTGYVRCKLGSDTTEYLRDDAVSHVMLEFSDNESGFSAGACAEGFTDGRTLEHFWIAPAFPVSKVAVRDNDGEPFSWRQFKDMLSGIPGAQTFDSKKLYVREFTGKLGIWRKNAEYNPYLEAFTRSVSFTPLVSVDKFVCDYILEDRPVEIRTMKANLESYKEAEREAKAAALRIDALKKILVKAAEWRDYEELIIKQEYVKLAVEKINAEQKKNSDIKKLERLEAQFSDTEKEIASLTARRVSLEHEMRETDTALARNDAHSLYQRIEEQIERLKLSLGEEEKKARQYALHRSQCEQLLDRKLKDNPEDDISWIEQGESESRAKKEDAKRQKEDADTMMRDALAELEELRRGIPRYDEGPTRLKAALEEAGITAHFLADVAEVTDLDWADAVEGWLNTLRFAVLVEPKQFQRALEIYDSLPRSVAGAFLPNLGKMRESKSKEYSLARLVETSSLYARYYVDFILGDVICADIATLKNYHKAVTKECMTYSNYTASRIREQVYQRHYLGQAAKTARKEFLMQETERLRGEFAEAEDREHDAAQWERIFHTARGTVTKLCVWLPSVQKAQELRGQIEERESELAAIDTTGFKELQQKRAELSRRIHETTEELSQQNRLLGKTGESVSETKNRLAEMELDCENREDAVKKFRGEHTARIAGCEAYADEQIRENGIPALLAGHESALKKYRGASERIQKDYRLLVQNYDREFNALLSMEPQESAEAEKIKERLVTSELPEYREKIEKTRRDAEREFKDHFIAVLNERIENTYESFYEINATLKTLRFGRDQYSFHLEPRNDRRAQIEIIRKAAEIPAIEDGLFNQMTNPAELKAAQELFERILNANLDSPELRNICDYRTYFQYDIKITDTESVDANGKPVKSSLSKVLREKSGGESQTPYYVAIAASFYRFYQDRQDKTVRLVMFDEAFNKMDDERIGKILEFYKKLNIQIVSAVPTEKIEAMVPHMDTINIVIRHDRTAFVRRCAKKNGALSFEDQPAWSGVPQETR